MDVKPPNNPPILISVAEAARLLGVGRSTVYDIIGRGDLRVAKIGRRTLVSVAEVETYARGSLGYAEAP